MAAAGSSSRMGTCKALLPYAPNEVADTSFVQRLVEIYAACGISPIVVTAPDDPNDATRLCEQLAHVPTVVTRNALPADGLSGSIVTALAHAPDAEALLVSPVDCPFVDVALVHALLVSLRVGVAAAPVVGDTRGHPVGFGHLTFELLACAGQRGGPRAVLTALGSDVVEVPWSDPRICDDVDTPEDYERLFGRPLAVRR